MNTFANIKTITKRELGAYFSSPLAYVFLVIFLLLCGFFTFFVSAGVGTYFKRDDASLITFFLWHPLFYLFLVPAVGRVQASDGEALRHLALGGAGLARLAAFTARGDIAAGRLVPVLEQHHADDKEAFHAIYVGQGGPLPSRVRALLDFLALRGRVS